MDATISPTYYSSQGLLVEGEVRNRFDNGAPLALARMVPNSQSHPSIAPMQEVHDFVTDFAGPLSVVWGTRDPVLGSVLRWIRKILPHAELTETRAGHFLQEEVPAEIAAAVRSVARRIDDA